VLTLKRAPPDMEGDKTSVKRAAISGTAKCAPPKHELPPLPAKWTRTEIARLGQRAYHYADKVLSSPYNRAVAHLLEREVVLPGRGLRYSVKSRFEKEVESVAQCLRDDQGGLEKLITRELEKPPNEQQQSVLQQWRGQLRDLHKNWLARLWQDFAQGKLLAELPLDRWTVAQTEESLPLLLPATGVFSGFRRKGRQSFNKSLRFPFSPRPPKTTGFVLLPVPAIASLLIKGTTQFKDNAMQLLQSRGYREQAAGALARQFLLVKLRWCNKKSKVNRGSFAHISKYVHGDWGPGTVTGEATSTALCIVYALCAFDQVFSKKYVSQMGANPTIHCDGRNVHVVIQGVSCVKEGKSDDSLGGQEIQPLPGHIRLVGVDVNQDGLSFGVATARFQRDVELELLGDDEGSRVAEWPPDRNNDKGLQWMTGGTEEAMLRTRQHEKERAREKHQLNAIMVPGGIDGLERSQRDPSVCWDEQQLLASFHEQMLLLPFSTFLYNSPAAQLAVEIARSDNASSRKHSSLA